MPLFVDASYSGKNKILGPISKIPFDSKCTTFYKEKEHLTINRMKIRSIMHSLIIDGKEFLDDDENKYSSYDIYVLQKDAGNNLTAGKEMEVNGYVIADPKNAKITIMAVHVRELNENNYNIEKIKELQVLHAGKSLQEIVDWFASEFTKYTKIVKRKDLILGVILNMFSSLGFEFEYKIVRGWVNIIVIGDSTTGKSEIVRLVIKLAKSGQIVSGEMATIAGIAGASIQATGGQWFTDYGLLPLQDRKALWIDGAHKIPKHEMDKLAEAERSGKIEINKASKGSAWARTRQLREKELQLPLQLTSIKGLCMGKNQTG